jgi:hypothetical protein
MEKSVMVEIAQDNVDRLKMQMIDPMRRFAVIGGRNAGRTHLLKQLVDSIKLQNIYEQAEKKELGELR